MNDDDSEEATCTDAWNDSGYNGQGKKSAEHCYRPQRSCGQGNAFTAVCDSVHGGVCLSACWETTPQGDPPRRRPPKKEAPPKQTPQEGDPPRRRPPRRSPLPGPPPRGKLRGIRSRPTPKGEIEGDQIQAHTQGGN